MTTGRAMVERGMLDHGRALGQGFRARLERLERHGTTLLLARATDEPPAKRHMHVRTHESKRKREHGNPCIETPACVPRSRMRGSEMTSDREWDRCLSSL